MDTNVFQGLIDVFMKVVEMAGSVIDALVTSNGALSALFPYLLIGTGVSLLFVGVKVVKSLSWGH